MQKRFICFLIIDVFSFYFSLYLAYLSRDIIGEIFNVPYFNESFFYYLKLYPAILLFIGSFLINNLYFSKRFFWEELRIIFKALTVYTLLLFSFLSLAKISINYSRLLFVIHIIYLFLLVPFFRYLCAKILHTAGVLEEVGFIGGKDSLESFKKEIERNFYLGFKLSEKNSSNIVFISSKENWESFLLNNQLKYKKIYIYDDNEIFIIRKFRILYQVGKEHPLLEFENRLKDIKSIFVKRVFDLTLSIIFLPFFLILIFIIGLLIKIDSKGPIFFVQKRVGKNGKLFNCYKFRTMYINSDKILEDYLSKNEDAKKEWETYRKLKSYDPRITKIGKFLRKSSLDELPQIINVLKGEMSLVGPRPALKEEIELIYKELKYFYYEVSPGITGLWQISGRNKLTFKDRVELDTLYVINWSLWLDIVILIKTIKVVILREGSY